MTILEGTTVTDTRIPEHPISIFELNRELSAEQILDICHNERSAIRRDVTACLAEHSMIVGECPGIQSIDKIFNTTQQESDTTQSSPERFDMIPHVHPFHTFIRVPHQRASATGVMHNQVYLETILAIFDSFIINLAKNPKHKSDLQEWREDVEAALKARANLTTLGRRVEKLRNILVNLKPSISKQDILTLRQLISSHHQQRYNTEPGQVVEITSPWEGSTGFKIIGRGHTHYRVADSMQDFNAKNGLIYTTFS